MIQCVLNCAVTYAWKWGRGELDNKQWYDHVPKLVETGHEGRVTILILIYMLTAIGLTPGGSIMEPTV